MTLRGADAIFPCRQATISGVSYQLASPDVTGLMPSSSRQTDRGLSQPSSHLIPANGWQNLDDGLDGITIDLPALPVRPTDGPYLPLNLQIKDPLWPQRNLLDFSFSVKPNEARTLWLDTRDRILPAGKALYLTLAAAGQDFGPSSVEGARVRLIFKPRAEAAKEHELDRFTQARDSYAMLIEEHTNNPRLNLYNRFAADVTDAGACAAMVAAVSGKRGKRYLKRQQLLELGEPAIRYLTEIVHRRPRQWYEDVDRLHQILQSHGPEVLRQAMEAGLQEQVFGAFYVERSLPSRLSFPEVVQ